MSSSSKKVQKVLDFRTTRELKEYIKDSTFTRGAKKHKLQVVADLYNAEELAGASHYKGILKCPLCLTQLEPINYKLGDFVWDSRIEHYIKTHSIIPPTDFKMFLVSQRSTGKKRLKIPTRRRDSEDSPINITFQHSKVTTPAFRKRLVTALNCVEALSPRVVFDAGKGIIRCNIDDCDYEDDECYYTLGKFRWNSLAEHRISVHDQEPCEDSFASAVFADAKLCEKRPTTTVEKPKQNDGQIKMLAGPTLMIHVAVRNYDSGFSSLTESSPPFLVKEQAERFAELREPNPEVRNYEWSIKSTGVYNCMPVKE